MTYLTAGIMAFQPISVHLRHLFPGTPNQVKILEAHAWPDFLNYCEGNQMDFDKCTVEYLRQNGLPASTQQFLKNKPKEDIGSFLKIAYSCKMVGVTNIFAKAMADSIIKITRNEIRNEIFRQQQFNQSN